MKKTFLILISFVCVCGFAVAGEDTGDYSQKYAVFMEGVRSGMLTVTEKIDENGNLVALTNNEIYIESGLDTNRAAFTTRMIRDKKSRKIKSYVFNFITGNTGDSYELVVKGDEITRTLNSGGKTTIKTAPYNDDTIILDFNAYYLYEYAIRKYDNKKKGRQLFSSFIPVIGYDLPFAITFLEDAALALDDGDLSVKKYQVEFVGLRTGMVYIDRKGRLVLLGMPDQKLEVLREDLVPENP